jgi:hypothetical protein
MVAGHSPGQGGGETGGIGSVEWPVDETEEEISRRLHALLERLRALPVDQSASLAEEICSLCKDAWSDGQNVALRFVGRALVDRKLPMVFLEVQRAWYEHQGATWAPADAALLLLGCSSRPMRSNADACRRIEEEFKAGHLRVETEEERASGPS